MPSCPNCHPEREVNLNPSQIDGRFNCPRCGGVFSTDDVRFPQKYEVAPQKYEVVPGLGGTLMPADHYHLTSEEVERMLDILMEDIDFDADDSGFYIHASLPKLRQAAINSIKDDGVHGWYVDVPEFRRKIKDFLKHEVV